MKSKSVVTKSVTRYLLVNRNDIGDFMEAVDTSLKEGWQCQGGVSIIHWTGNYPSTRYHQAMTKVVDLLTEDDEPSKSVADAPTPTAPTSVNREEE